jgi:hypothetical protein
VIKSHTTFFCRGNFDSRIVEQAGIELLASTHAAAADPLIEIMRGITWLAVV